MTRLDRLSLAALLVGGFVGMNVGVYRFFLATEQPSSWFVRTIRLR